MSPSVSPSSSGGVSADESSPQLDSRYRQIQEKITQLTATYQRPDNSVRLIAVSKKHPASKVAALARLGQRDFAENYAQEGIEKIAQVTQQLDNDHGSTDKPLCWHFIGHIQSRKCQQLAENFDWIHTIDRIKTAQKLNQYRTSDTPLNVLIQLNLHAEQTKSGVSKSELLPLAKAVSELPNLRLRGLMIIPKPETEFAKQRIAFAQCRELRDELNTHDLNLDHLSMGMTADLEAAVAEEATMLRIGTAIFGPRSEK